MPLRKLMRTIALAITLATLAAAPAAACSGGEENGETTDRENGQAAAQRDGRGNGQAPPQTAPQGNGQTAPEEADARGAEPGAGAPGETPATETGPTAGPGPTDTPHPTAAPKPTPEPTAEPTAEPRAEPTAEPAAAPPPAPATSQGPGRSEETARARRPSDICERTPEVQNAIIAALAREGPRMSCQDINEREMYRIRRLEVKTPQLQQGDLGGMPNLQTMSLSTGLDNLQALAPETFEGMSALYRLSLSLRHPSGYNPPHRNEQFAAGAFARLRSLYELEIRIAQDSPGLLMTRKTLAGMENLVRLDVDHIHAIDPDTLQVARNLQIINLTGQYSLEPTKQQRLHPDIFEPLPGLENVALRGLGLPGTLNLGSFEAACHAQTWIPRDEDGEPAAEIFVERQRVELMKPTDGGRASGCLLRIGDNRIIEIP